MFMRTFTVVLTLIVLGVASSCKKNETSYFPSVAFEQRVYLSNPSSFDLSVPGGWIYTDGGYKGLIIYRRYLNGGQDDFIALDRGCPTHYSESGNPKRGCIIHIKLKKRLTKNVSLFFYSA